MNKKIILLVLTTIIALTALVGCEGNIDNKDDIKDSNMSGEIEKDTSSGEIKDNFVSGENSTVVTIKPTKTIEVSDKLRAILSKYKTEDLEILSDKSKLEQSGEMNYETLILLNDWLNETSKYIFRSWWGTQSPSLESSYFATSTLKAEGYDYSVENLKNANMENVWIEGVAGYGIGEKVTLKLQRYTVEKPTDFGFVGNIKDGFRIMTKEEFDKVDPIENQIFYVKDEERKYTYDEYIELTKSKVQSGNGYFNSLTGLCIINGYAKNEELFNANSRVKKLKLTIDNDREYIIELEDTMNPQLIDISYSQEPSFEVIKPLELTFEILEVYPGEKYQDTVITSILSNTETNMKLGN